MNSGVSVSARDEALTGWDAVAERSGVCGCLAARRRRLLPLRLDVPRILEHDVAAVSRTLCGVDTCSRFLLLLAVNVISQVPRE